MQKLQKQGVCSKVVGEGESSEGYNLTGKREERVKGNVKITIDDIKDEIIYWKSAVICYTLGSNPPQTVMEGYFKRIWGSLGIDKIAQVNRGVFIVRFHSLESKEKVVEKGVRLFDKVKPRSPDIMFNKQVVDKNFVCIRLINLDIKYWGQNAQTKIAGMIGNPLKVDRTTMQKQRL